MSAKDYTVASPNGKNVVKVSDGLTISVSHAGKKIVSVQTGLNAVRLLGQAKQLNRTETISAPFYRQKEFTVA